MSLWRANFSSSYTLGLEKSVCTSKDVPRSRHTTLNPALASSIDMIEPTTPLPTTTTSTDFNFVFDISILPVAFDNHVFRKAFRVDRHLTGLDVEHADGFGVIWFVSGDKLSIFATGQLLIPAQLPPPFVPAPGIQGIREVPLLGV